MLLDKVDPEGVSAVIMSLVQCCSYYEHTLVGILQRGCLFCYSAVATRQCYSQQHCDEPHFTFPSVCLHNTGIFCNNFDYSFLLSCFNLDVNLVDHINFQFILGYDEHCHNQQDCGDDCHEPQDTLFCQG